jgi:IS1 family transposase/transposase-like protein
MRDWGIDMASTQMKCPFCHNDNVIKNGKDENGKQRYKCKNKDCSHSTFVVDYDKNGYDPYIKKQILKMTVNGNGIRAIARTLDISTNTVLSELKKKEDWLNQVNINYIESHRNSHIEADLIFVEEVEMDEMWSFVHDKSQQYWLWWAIDHNTGEPLAYVLGTREHKFLDELLELLNIFDIDIVFSDDNFAYKNHIKDSLVITGKRNTQKIERKHLSLRTWCSRLVRKGIRFSKTHQMHRIALGLVINFWFFCRVPW